MKSSSLKLFVLDSFQKLTLRQNCESTDFKEGEYIFWFHSYDVLHENRASIHVGKGSQSDSGDAKIWLEPKIETARSGRTLSQNDLDRVIKIIEQNFDRLQEAWNAHKRKTE